MTVMTWIFLPIENLIFPTLKLVIISGNTNKSITKESNVASSEAQNSVFKQSGGN